MPPEDIQRRIAGAICFAIGVVGIIALLVATATPRGIIAVGTFYAPLAFVVLVIALFLILFIEAGCAGLNASAAWQVSGSIAGSPLLTIAALVLFFALPVFGLAGLGLVWIARELLHDDLAPQRETYVVAGVFFVYAVIRIPIALRWIDGGELARAVGVRPGGPEPGEPLPRFAARTAFGFVLGVFVLDALIVLVNAALAPGDTTFYPGASAVTPLAALLWMVGLMGAGSIVAETIRTRVVLRSIRAVLAATALVPAIILDARIPLYPFVAGIASGQGTITLNDVPLRTSAAQTPFVPLNPNPPRTTVPTPGPDAMVSGLVRWGELAVPAVNVTVLNNGIPTFVPTDVDGHYRASVRSGTVAVSVDVRSISSATWFDAATPAAMRVNPGGELSYPTIYMTRRINPSEPVVGASVQLPVTLRWQPQWQSLDAAVTYLVRVFDDGAIAAPTPSPAPQVTAVRIAGTSLPVTSLVASHRYRWSVEAWAQPRAGGPELPIGRSGTSSFATR